MRRGLYELFLFLLPFALYFLYTRVAKRDEEGKLGHEHPWVWLFVTGLLLVIGSFIWLGIAEGAGSKGEYVPAQNRNGEVTPGHYNPPPAPAAAP